MIMIKTKKLISFLYQINTVKVVESFWMNRKAVSPVIGVILMVAATIVIAAIVMGYLGGFKPPSKPLDIQLGNAQGFYNKTNWTVEFTIAGGDANVLTNKNVLATIVNTTGTTLNGNIVLIDHSLLKIIGSNEHASHSYYYVNDNHPQLRVIIKYKPTGQILFDGQIIAYNATS